MAPVIEAIRNEIATIVKAIPEEVMKQMPSAKLLLRVALVPFHDRGDAVPPITPFSDPEPGPCTEETLREFNEKQAGMMFAALKGLRAEGGGDIPEDTLPALKRATKELAWKGKVRYAVLITDAPPHGSRFHDATVKDDFPGEGSELEPVIEDLVQNQTELVVFHVNSTYTGKMASEMALAVIAASKLHPGCIPETRGGILIQSLFDPAAPAAQFGGIHAVFVLDESGSMSGVFPGVIKAYQMFLAIRRGANQGRSNDIISVVNFSHVARIIFEGSAVAAAVNTLPFASGGTDFGPAMDRAAEILGRDATAGRSHLTPVIIFMSDGCGGSGVTQLEKIRAAHGARGLQVHVLAFGGADATSLKAHAKAGGDESKFQAVPDVNSLAQTFEAIARSTQGASGLVKEIAGQVSRNIADRIVFDHL